MLPLLLTAVLGTPQDQPEFTVSGADSDTPTGKLTAISLTLGAQVSAGDGPKTVKGVVSLRQAGRPLPPFPDGAHLVTAIGDRIPGAFGGGDAKQLRFRHVTSTDDWAITADMVAAVWLRPPPADTPPDPAKYAWLNGTAPRDALLYRNGDTARGAITGFTEHGVKFTTDAGAPREVPLVDLTAIGFNPRLVRARKPKGPFAHLVLTDGTRLVVSEVAVKGNALVCTAVCGPAFEVKLAQLVALDVMQGAATYLSDLKPAKAETVGFLGPTWDWAADRSVRGQPLRLKLDDDENTFDKGLGTHPKTVLTYDLAGKYTRFESLVGLDTVTGKRGRADVRIRVDGKEVPLPELKALTAGNAVPVKVDVRGAKELRLVIGFGPAGDVQADVNWGAARLVAE
ncbi:NPCBM/NEW2 domain-containing protein [Gemmata sp. JC717]|uniref:NPCBM/NEW2 domain-containing protein n=1 Tax=Gemmata algarum TaxID=2975278 RepID=UPI0021BB717B|nr:NPCBM/NEW2 domain-containing protein [Gemmata algarum]MDY3556543.1 NPCBM/NEW2 domain-containing protein [Gemmata algarum]